MFVAAVRVAAGVGPCFLAGCGCGGECRGGCVPLGGWVCGGVTAPGLADVPVTWLALCGICLETVLCDRS